jgi:hypothetical protein
MGTVEDGATGVAATIVQPLQQATKPLVSGSGSFAEQWRSAEFARFASAATDTQPCQ